MMEAPMLRLILLASFLFGFGILAVPIDARADEPPAAETPLTTEERLARAKAAYDALSAILPPRDWKPIFQEFLALAQEGNAEAQQMVGRMYRLGKGVEFDRCEAVFWTDKAARAGNPSAQATLGYEYWYPDTGGSDYDLAYLWLKTAALNGKDDAKEKVRRLVNTKIKSWVQVSALDKKLRTWRPEDQPPIHITRLPNIWGLNVLMAIFGYPPCTYVF